MACLNLQWVKMNSAPVPSLVVMGPGVRLEFAPDLQIVSRNLAPNALMVNKIGRECEVSHSRSSFFSLLECSVLMVC